jgi:hypothetical protein
MLAPEEVKTSYSGGVLKVRMTVEPFLEAAGKPYDELLDQLRQEWGARGGDPQELENALNPGAEYWLKRLKEYRQRQSG